MNLKGIRENDIIECDVKGRRFFAFFDGRLSPGQGLAQGGGIKVTPITPGITYRNVKAVDVIGHYRRSKASAPRLREEVSA